MTPDWIDVITLTWVVGAKFEELAAAQGCSTNGVKAGRLRAQHVPSQHVIGLKGKSGRVDATASRPLQQLIASAAGNFTAGQAEVLTLTRIQGVNLTEVARARGCSFKQSISGALKPSAPWVSTPPERDTVGVDLSTARAVSPTHLGDGAAVDGTFPNAVSPYCVGRASP